MNIRSIFISPAEPRLRAGWRLLLQTLLLFVLSIVISLPLGALAFFVDIPTSSLLFGQVIELLVFAGSIFIARRWLDRRSFVSLGVKPSPSALRDVLAGILIAFPMMGLIFWIEWAAGWLTFEGFAWQIDPLEMVIRETLFIFIVFVLVGWNEELLSRGYHLQTLESGLNTFWAVLLSSAVFGVMHLSNPNATWVSAAGILLAGVFLAYGYLRTRQLWLPIGLHIGWNFFEGVGFGFPVSGLDLYPLTRITVTGPELITGGAFGPEAGLVVIPGIALGMLLVWAYSKSRAVSGESRELDGQNP